MDREKTRELQYLKETVSDLDRDLDAVIVEGKSDQRVMKKLGFEGRIFQSAERKIEDLSEDVGRAAETVAVLTDFDSHGRRQAKKITHALQEEVDVVNSARRSFGEQLGYNDRYAVEDVGPLLESKWEKFTDATLDRLF